jgi:hypothetical protein
VGCSFIELINKRRSRRRARIRTWRSAVLHRRVRGGTRRKSESTERMRDRGLLSWPSSRTRDNTSCTLNDQCFLLGSVLVWSSSGCSHLRNKWPDGPEKKPQGGSLALSRNEGRQEPALRSGREAPSSFGRRQRRAVRRTRRSVSIASPQAGRGTECDRPEALRMRRLRRTTSGIA